MAAAGEDEKEEVIQMPRGRGFGWWGFGWGPGWGPGWGMGRGFFGWGRGRGWFGWGPGWGRLWAYPYGYGMGPYMAGMPYSAGVYPTAGMPYGAGMYPTAGAPYYSPYRGYPAW